MQNGDVKRSINLLRGKSNEITVTCLRLFDVYKNFTPAAGSFLKTSAGKHIKPTAPVDFAGYKSKLKFTAAAVDSLEKNYSSTKLPQYSATLSSLETQRRAALVSAYFSNICLINI